MIRELQMTERPEDKVQPKEKEAKGQNECQQSPVSKRPVN